MNYIVVDFEFNQAYDFKNNKKGEHNGICPFEIIQIGAVKLDENFNIVDNGTFNELIKPTIYKDLHPHVSKITGLTDDKFVDAQDFPFIINSFLEFCGEDCIFVVWGNNDVISLYRNLMYYDLLELPFSKKYINLQKYVSAKLKYVGGTQIGLKNALITLNVPFDENFHDAFYDAKYTAEIFRTFSGKNFNFQNFQLKSILKTKKTNNRKTKTNELFVYIEKSLGRPLKNSEKNLYLEVYNLGKGKKFN